MSYEPMSVRQYNSKWKCQNCGCYNNAIDYVCEECKYDSDGNEPEQEDKEDE